MRWAKAFTGAALLRSSASLLLSISNMVPKAARATNVAVGATGALACLVAGSAARAAGATAGARVGMMASAATMAKRNMRSLLVLPKQCRLLSPGSVSVVALQLSDENRRARQQAEGPRRSLHHGIRRDHRRWSRDAHHAVALAATEEVLADRQGRRSFPARLRHPGRGRGSLARLWGAEVRLDHHGGQCRLSRAAVRHSFLQAARGNQAVAVNRRMTALAGNPA